MLSASCARHALPTLCKGRCWGGSRITSLPLTRQLARLTASTTPSKGHQEWPVSRVRSQFVDYFQSHKHSHIKSSPVVPVNDPTLLFTNAGMNQFKPIFMGAVDPTSPLASLKRATNSQKCIRAGGKHNDLDDVGKDTYHHTFFEMLGTWSFGQYFKEDAIRWAFDLLVNVYKLPKDRLYVSYFAGCEEDGIPADTAARDLWLQYLPADRVLAFGKKENFWEMGETGPCGPCTEIHFDRIGGRNAASLVNMDDPDVLEIWNLVFIQFNRENSGKLTLLPEKHVDTGMGLERLTSILQHKHSNYDTDVFVPIFEAIHAQVGCAPYAGKVGTEDDVQGHKDMAYRVIADHIRTLCFAIADGATPSNDGRGYVLRRILRRAVRYGMQTLGAERGFFSKLVAPLVAEYGEAFPELRTKKEEIEATLREEEASFSTLLDSGIKYFSEHEVKLREAGLTVISGEVAFYMYDSLGFPIDLTQIMATEKGLTVDLPGFHSCMQQQKDRSHIARANAKRIRSNHEPVVLSAVHTAALVMSGALPAPADGKQVYNWDITVPTRIQAILVGDKLVQRHELNVAGTQGDASGAEDSVEVVGIVLEDSPFYAEAGGQVADMGTISFISADNVKIMLDVVDVQSYAGYRLHTCTFLPAQGALEVGCDVQVQVDYCRRHKVAPNHTMTHVLNFALRQVLGPAVDQKGSHVSDERLRFDFSHKRALTVEELVKVEDIVNEAIAKQMQVFTQTVPLSAAMEINGLRAVFGEAYPDPVRVVSVGADLPAVLSSPTDSHWSDYSVEFCGGTHLHNTSDAMACCVVEESGIAKGIRRISAITGEGAVAAIAETNSCKERILQLANSIHENLSIGEYEILEQHILELRGHLDAAIVSQGAKKSMRSELEGMQKKTRALRTAARQVHTSSIIRQAVQEATEWLEQSDSPAVVQVLELGSDAAAVKSAIEQLKKIHPDFSYLGISTNPQQLEQQEGKLSFFAFVSDAGQQQGLHASDWVCAAAQVCGGKGGGKANLALGSALLPHGAKDKKEVAVQAAREYLASTLRKPRRAQ